MLHLRETTVLRWYPHLDMEGNLRADVQGRLALYRSVERLHNRLAKSESQAHTCPLVICRCLNLSKKLKKILLLFYAHSFAGVFHDNL
jgi:hypothetical protein